MIVIIDIGTGNLGSILHVMRKINQDVIISSNADEIATADKLILPGVGSFDPAINNINKMQLFPVLNDLVIKDKVPILGICLGIQLFTQKSEEGTLPGFGWIDGQTVKFKFPQELANLKIPHMGWNTAQVRSCASIFNGIHIDARYYFVHSFHVECNDEKDILATTHYGYDFVSAIEKDNIFGTQFHPEKSHKFGQKILQNFSEMG
jgi:glutamine amidotransferase